MNRQSRIQANLLYCLCNLLLECLDKINATSELMARLKDNLIEICEEINNVSVDTDIVQKSTHFQELSNKINTLVRKSVD